MRRFSLLVALSLMLSAVPALAQNDDAPAVAADDEGGGRRSAFRSPGGLLDRSEHTRDQQLAFQIGIPWYFYGGFPIGISGRYYFPIVPNGFIPAINDEFGLEAGVDFAIVFGGYIVPAIDIPIAARWAFHLTEDWTVFAKIGFGLGLTFLGSYSYGGYYGGTWVRFVFESQVGAMYKINDVLSLRLDLGYPWAKFGVVISL